MRAILLGEEISVGDGASIEADEAINLLLIAAEGVEEALHLRRERSEGGALAGGAFYLMKDILDQCRKVPQNQIWHVASLDPREENRLGICKGLPNNLIR